MSSFGTGIWSMRAASGAVSASRASSVTEVQNEVRELERSVEKLTLINYALWTMLQEKLDMTEADLLERVRVVDLLDGKLDGRLKEKTVAKCDACNRTMSKRHVRCMYCGEENLSVGAFETVL